MGCLSLAILLFASGIAFASNPMQVLRQARLLQEDSVSVPPQLAFDLVLGQEISWNSANPSADFKQFDFLESKHGEGFARYRFRMPKHDELPHLRSVDLWLKDPYYIDGRIAMLTILIEQDFNLIAKGWQGLAKCAFKLQQNHTFVRASAEPFDCNYSIESSVNVSSDGFAIQTHARDPVYHSYLPWTLMLPNLAICISLLLLKRRLPPSHKFSLLTIGLALNTIVFVSIREMNFGVEGISSPQAWFLLTGFTTFLCAVHFTYTFVAIVSRLSAAQYCGFYLLTFGYVWLIVNCSGQTWFLIANSLVLLPQLIHNELYVMGALFDPAYLVCVFGYHSYTLYMYGFPRNKLQVEPRMYTCLAIVVLILLQVLLNYLQSRTSRRLLLPKFLLEGRFNIVEVHHIKPSNHQDLGECPICLVSLAGSHEHVERQTVDTETESCIPHTVQLLRTPCNHKYHLDCLKNWMEHKLECPVDRKPLTPIIIE